MPHRPPARRRVAARGGFTLIEILIVVALLVVLSSLVVIGVGKMQLNAKRQQTRLILHNLQSMYAEYDAVVRPKFPVDQRVVAECPGPVTVDGSVNASGVIDTYSNFRYRGDVQLTCSLYSLMRSVPSVRAGFDKLPPQEVMANTVSFAPQYAVNPYLPGASYDVFSQSPKSTYATIADANGAYAVYLFRRTGSPPGSGVTGPRPPDLGYWFPYLNDATVRPVLDAWGNPIIVCLGAYIGDAITSPPVAPTPLASRPTAKNDGKLYVNGFSTTLKSPDLRPFFLSAGPDGDFGLGDDNIYSFDP